MRWYNHESSFRRVPQPLGALRRLEGGGPLPTVRIGRPVPGSVLRSLVAVRAHESHRSRAARSRGISSLSTGKVLSIPHGGRGCPVSPRRVLALCAVLRLHPGLELLVYGSFDAERLLARLRIGEAGRSSKEAAGAAVAAVAPASSSVAATRLVRRLTVHVT